LKKLLQQKAKHKLNSTKISQKCSWNTGAFFLSN
jgi:hypothetical protein